MQEVSIEKRGRQAAQAKALFGFARELGRVRRENIIWLDRHPWFLKFSSIDPKLPGVKKWTPESGEPNLLLSVEQLQLPHCPEPPALLREAVGEGWEKPEWEPGSELIERAASDEKFGEAWLDWGGARKDWLLHWEAVSKSLDLFQMLYQKSREVEDSNLRLIAKAGSISFASDDAHLAARHPVLTRPIRFRLIVDENRVTIRVEVDLSEPARFESELLSGFQDDGFRLELCQATREDVESTNVHPFDTQPVRASFQKLAATISPESRWSDSGKPPEFDDRVHFGFYEDPVFWIEERVSGMAEASDRIIREIDAGEKIPQHLIDLVSGVEERDDTAPAKPSETLEDRLAAAGGEDASILLTKPANREQLEVAREIRNRDAVLVMGPPGTGKTHTIANLIGDFLSCGKTVLISSQKEKALRVIKSMLPAEMQDLCISFSSEEDDVLATVQALTEKLSLVRPEELERKIEAETAARDRTFKALQESRSRLYSRLNAESEKQEIGGRSWTPTEIGTWLHENEALEAVLPGRDTPTGPFPLTEEELRTLYSLSGVVTREVETESLSGMLETDTLPQPEEQAHLAAEASELRDFVRHSTVRVEARGGQGGQRIFRYVAGDLAIEAPEKPGGPVAMLSDWLEKDRTVGIPEPWVASARAAGAAGGAIKARWEKLLAAVQAASELAEKEIGQMDEFAVEIRPDADRPALREALNYFRENRISGEPGFLTKLTQKTRLAALGGSLVNGHVPSTDHDYASVLLRLDLEEARAAAMKLWNDLVQKEGGPAFESLGTDHPEEQVRLRYVPRLEKALSWWTGWAEPLLRKAEVLGINPALITGGTGVGPVESCGALARSVEELLRPAAALDRVMDRLTELRDYVRSVRESLKPAIQKGSKLAVRLSAALDESPEAYQKAWEDRETLRELRPQIDARSELLQRLASGAPAWARAIAERRSTSCPKHAIEAWDWKLLDSSFESYLSTSMADEQKKAEELSSTLRRQTVTLAVDRAWLALSERMRENRALMQKLQGWAQIAARIGRGNGRNVETLRAQARDLMSSCAQAVPCWIMPAERALAMFDGTWKFDVIVLDEASQSDIVSMPLLFLANRAVIAGDDRQVSPAAVGVGDMAVNALSRQYIEGKIANWPIYQAQSSLYDLARTAYDPLMLREHFRSVPPIIGYSNQLSYNGLILPLRDAASTNLVPAIVRCRVNGVREQNDANKAEAEAIVGRIKACIGEKAYDGKTFGVIVMRSGKTGAQIQLINDLLYKALGPEVIQSRRILCGLSPDFQGDERDVIFLSLVDSPDGDKPLRREGAGSDDGMKKRWNVAVSRARDQIWAVYSFDPATQLQEGDIRKTFFDYLSDLEKNGCREEDSGLISELASEVADGLEEKGFTVHKGYRIGAFDLDLVVEENGKKVIVECDGDAGTPIPNAVIARMECQTILERAGWQFVRVRGGAWSRDPESGLWWLMSQLAEKGVRPSAEEKSHETEKPADLVTEVQSKAETFTKTLRVDSDAAEAKRLKRERIIAELRKLGAEVDSEVKKSSRFAG